MKILLTGATGGIGSAIKESLQTHEVYSPKQGEFICTDNYDWLIFAQGLIEEFNINRLFEANVVSQIGITERMRPHLKQGVIYISSTAGINGNSKFPVYSASKAALNCYAKAMAKAHPKLQFYAVCPGPTDTKMWRSLGLEGKAQSPEVVAKAVSIIMKGICYTSGAIIEVRNGAMSLCK